jgi:broad specificity phosphatase PhoE
MDPTRTRMLLVRHGQTPWNARGLWQGHGDPGLTEEGMAQARALAETLAAQPDAGWSRVIASDLARAHATAAEVAARLGLPVEHDLRLRELDVGEWSGLSRDEIARLDPDTLRAFDRGEPSVRPGGGESRIEIRERTHAFVRELVDRCKGESVIVVTHLGVIRALLPGARPGNVECIECVAEEIAARPIDRHRRREEEPL